MRMLSTEQVKRREEAAKAEVRIDKLLARYYPEYIISKTPSRYSRVDGFLLDRDTHAPKIIYETKARNQSLSDLVGDDYSFSIDTAKLLAMQHLSDLLRIEGVIFTYLLGDGVLLRTPVTSRSGGWSCQKKTEEVLAPCNLGGEMIMKSMSTVKLDNSQILITGGSTGSV